ncbi:hypothetical protein [Edaphobacillus lindanitolerans]|uniref:Uncharacterized protein n=1 Tax=Edaphobacillus lindanitolerans TaxID=550447 RepID=A0A1U7PIB8_9BACI|nr:hypothetical protein [Edaphobacillus lindanitolerans]SIT72864.1 hypothetical protein SAMN05428946_0911 [Edaphobacillus lindanitolerans]
MNKKMMIKRSAGNGSYSSKGRKVIAYSVNGEEQVGRVIIERAANYPKPEYLDDENFWKKKIHGLKMQRVH